MGIFRKLFGRGKQETAPHPSSKQASKVDLANDPNLIKVFDKYGRETFITRQDWKNKVLLDNLEKVRDDADQLYGMLVAALQDGFAVDVIPHAEHLWRTDTIPARGATTLGIAYMETSRLDEAQRVLEDFLEAHGDDGYVLTNLAKVHSHRGDDARAEAILWHALEVDPNQDNGFIWYVAIQRERGGESAEIKAFRRVARLPRSWRAQLWLARDALQSKNLAAAEAFYAEALERVERPVPSDFLMQMSGDLGRNGHVAEIVRLVEPHFNSEMHGLQVGNNLVKAHLDLGHLDSARLILDQLYAQNRHDWQETLRYWDAELAKADIAQIPAVPAEQLSVSLISIEGALWARDGSPFAGLLPVKSADAPHIEVFGSTALVAETSEKLGAQLSDRPGRLSRSIPLFLAERIHLTTNAAAHALIPWAQDHGFALFSLPHKDQELLDLAGKGETACGYVVSITLDATQPRWKAALRVLRRVDGQQIAEAQAEAVPDNPGPAVEWLVEALTNLLIERAAIQATPAPVWYQIPIGYDCSDYLLRIEQQLAVVCMNLEFLKGGGLHGEHEIIDGILQLCVRQPTNLLVRMVFCQTLRQMQKVRPEILRQYKEKSDLLQRDHPLSGEVAQLIEKTIAAVFEDLA